MAQDISKKETTQTAVEWLKGMLEWNYGDPQMLEITWENLDDLLERAKAMEKEQLEKAYYTDCVSRPVGVLTRLMPIFKPFENYFKETYGS